MQIVDFLLHIDKYLDLLQQKKAFANLATVMSDGSPQVTPVWFDYDGEHILINSAKGRTKDRNMRKNPSVALSIMDPANPYRTLEIRARAEIAPDSEYTFPARLAIKYGPFDYSKIDRPGQMRLVVSLRPVKVNIYGS